MKKMMFLMLVLVVLGTASVKAQVAIGDETAEPHAGAILDLSPLGTKKLGLLLPNVTLGSTASDFVLVAGATEQQKKAATGMLVYNASTNLRGEGLYVWNGTEWKLVTRISN